jgi:hypothetical protein
MNGYGLAAVVVASVAAVVVTLLWALVRVSQEQPPADGVGVELSGGKALTGSRAGRGGVLRRHVAEAAERSRRGQDCE